MKRLCKSRLTLPFKCQFHIKSMLFASQPNTKRKLDMRVVTISELKIKENLDGF